MKISIRKKTLGIAFSAILIISIISILTPALGVKNSPKVTISNSYGYGYCCDPHTPGYWKNHPANWPVETITIGGIPYTKTNAITLMKEATGQGNGKGADKTYNMFEHLVAAKLNVLNGCGGCIDDTILDVDAWMAAHHVGTGVTANSDAWQNEGQPLFNILVKFNEGLLCP